MTDDDTADRIDAYVAERRDAGTYANPHLEHLCEVMHDAYERAAAGNGWETQQASRKPWSEVPAANQATMRVAVQALLDELAPCPDCGDSGFISNLDGSTVGECACQEATS